MNENKNKEVVIFEGMLEKKLDSSGIRPNLINEYIKKSKQQGDPKNQLDDDNSDFKKIVGFVYGEPMLNYLMEMNYTYIAK